MDRVVNLLDEVVLMKKWMFISIEAILYGIFLWMDLFAPEWASQSLYIKYASILLCFLYVLIFARNYTDKKDGNQVRLILFFTLVSDTFLLLVQNYAIGMTTFLVAQLLHWNHLREGKPLKNHWILGIGLSIMIVLALLGIPIDYVLVISVFYFLCMVRNASYGLFHRENLLLSIGLVLFLCCDINVGLNNVSSYLAVPEAFRFFVYNVVSVAMWFFYLPSQVLIALSIRDKSR